MVSITLIGAFVAGIISFFSPCVLPLIPGFMTHISSVGLKVGEVPSRLRIFLNTVAYVLGFAIVFATLGVLLNTALSSISYSVQLWLSRIGGLVIIFFGLFSMGLLKIPMLYGVHKLFTPKKTSSSYLSSFIFGAAFAVGWTPCVGALLGAILTLAISQPGIALSLLLVYSAGLGLPFLVLGLFLSQATAVIKKMGPSLERIQQVAGALLVLIGILMFTQTLPLIVSYFVG